MYEHNNECRAIEAIGQDWSSEVVALFLEDWELGRVALSRHMTLDLLCQETKGCMLGYLRVAGFSSFTAFAVSGRFSFGRVRGLSAWKVNWHSQRKALLSTVDWL